VAEIALDQIDHNPYQTRGIFREEELRELADSIRVTGVIQPIVVRPGKDGRFILILGERRCRASKLAGKSTIPALVRPVSEQHAAEMTIIENLQRADLNCLEQARAFARLSQEFKLTQEQIGQRTGCSRESVGNHLRLLKLPAEVQQLLLEGQLDFSMARVLLTLHNAELIPQIAGMAIRDNLSVKQLEALVQDVNLPPSDKPPAPVRVVDPNVRAAQQELERVLGVKVEIRDRHGKGKIVLQYANLDDFDRVLEMLSGK
jgi:ParB family chromosome partitioning protein